MLIILFLFLCLPLSGAIGCRNACHEPVECNCKCREFRMGDYKGLCKACGHFGEPDRGVASKDAVNKASEEMSALLLRARDRHSNK